MTIFSTADETRRQARESREKGVPASRDALPKIEGETGYYIDTFSETPSDSSTGDSTDESGTTTTNTQENDPNETSGGDSATGGSNGSGGGTNKTTFDADSPLTMAQPQGEYTDADSLEDTDSAPANGEPCIGCDVDKLNNITEGDCANTGGDSGDCVRIHYDGEFPTPDGWADPDTPPEDTTWVSGYRWLKSGSESPDIIGQAGNPATAATKSEWAANVYSEIVRMYNAYDPESNSTFINLGSQDVIGSGEDATRIRGVTKRTWNGGVSTQNYVWYANRGTCVPSEGSETCPTSAPTTTETWPDDGCYDLIFDGTGFKGSSRDPNLPAKYSGNGTSKVDYCTGSGADGTTRTGVNGGYQIETTDMMRYYDSDGKMRAAGDKTQTFIDQYKP